MFEVGSFMWLFVGFVFVLYGDVGRCVVVNGWIDGWFEGINWWEIGADCWLG